MILFYLIVLAITATVIINTLIMAVFERTREIGILAAIGMKGRRIMAMFFAESVLAGGGRHRHRAGARRHLVCYFSHLRHLCRQHGCERLFVGERIYAHLTLSDAITLVARLCRHAAGFALSGGAGARMEPVEALHGGE